MSIERHRSTPYSRFVSHLFRVQEQDVGRISLMFLYSLLAVGTFILGRIVRDILFLSMLPHDEVKSALSVMIGVSAIAVSGVSFVYSSVAQRFRRDNMIMIINSLLMVCMFGVYAMFLMVPRSWIPFTLRFNYVFIEVMGSLQVIQFWTLASELFDSRAAKRSFAIIGGGAVLANLLAFAIRPLVKALSGAIHLLPILASMLTLCILIVYLLGRQNREALEEQLHGQRKRKARKRAAGDQGSSDEVFWKNKHLLIVAGIIVVTFLTTTIIDYQFKASASMHFGGNKDALADYYSTFYGITGILACIVQFGLANRILQHAGIRFALLLLPIALFSGSLIFALGPMAYMIWATTAAKGSENVLRYTINDVSLNLMYVPVASELRARAKPFIDGILKPGTQAFASLIIYLLSGAGLQLHHLSWLSLLFLGGWFYLIVQAHREYLQTLMVSMEKRGLDLEESAFSLRDDGAIRALRQVLKSKKVDEIRHALELLPHIPNVAFEEELAELLSFEDEYIRVTALKLLADRGTPALRDKVAAQKEDSNPVIRAQAIETLCAIMTDEAIELVVTDLKDPSLRVRTAAIVGLIQHGGIDGILNAASDLKDLLENSDPSLRKVGAEVLGRLAIRNYYQPILRLLNDDEPRVRVAALEAAGALKSLKLLPALFEKACARETSQSAARALIQYGPEIFEQVAECFQNSNNREQVGSLARVLTHIGGQESFDTLREKLFLTRNAQVRYRLLYSMQRVLTHYPEVQFEREPLLKLLENEFRHYYQLALDQETVAAVLEQPETFREAMKEQREQVFKQVFEIIALLYPPPRQIRLILFQLQDGSPRMRANAIELLDNLLSADITRSLLPILEQERGLSGLAKDLYGLQPDTPENVLRRLFKTDDETFLALLLWTLGQNKLEEHLELVVEQLQTGDDVIRESCLLALGELLPNETYKIQLQKALDDPSSLVVRYADYRLKQAKAV